MIAVSKIFDLLVLTIPYVAFLPIKLSVGGINIYLIDFVVVCIGVMMMLLKKKQNVCIEYRYVFVFMIILVIVSGSINSSILESVPYIIRLIEGIIIFEVSKYTGLSVIRLKKNIVYAGLGFSVYLSYNYIYASDDFASLYGGVNAMFLGACVLLLIFEKNIFQNKIQWLLSFLIYCCVIIYDARRTSIIAFLLVYLLGIFIYRGKVFLLTIFIALVFGFAVLFGLHEYLPDLIYERLVSVFSDEGFQGISSFQTRLLKWELAKNIIKDNLLWGVGRENVYLGLDSWVSLGNKRVDNDYLAILLDYGVFVFIGYIYFYLKGLFVSYKSMDYSLLLVLVYVSVFGLMWTHYYGFTVYFIFYVYVILLLVKVDDLRICKNSYKGKLNSA